MNAPQPSWIKILQPPEMSSFLTSATGLRSTQIPIHPNAQRAALIAEATRIGICALAAENQAPVHPLKLRGWMRRKLEALIPDLFEHQRIDYRQVLADGRNGNLEFVGDVQVLEDGYLWPSLPARAVKISDGTFALVAGTPTKDLPFERDKIRLSAFSRQVTEVSESELRRQNVSVQPLEDYLRVASLADGHVDVLYEIRQRSPANIHATNDWLYYRTNRTSGYGFQWRDGIPTFDEVNGHRVGIWHEPVTDDYGKHYLSWDRKLYELRPNEWKRACLGLDAIIGHPRQALVFQNREAATVTFAISFPGFEALYRVLHVVGGTNSRFQNDRVEWEIPQAFAAAVQQVLEHAGVRVVRLGGGQA